MLKRILLCSVFLGMTLAGQSQTKEELETQKAEKQAIADAAQAEANAYKHKLMPYQVGELALLVPLVAVCQISVIGMHKVRQTIPQEILGLP